MGARVDLVAPGTDKTTRMNELADTIRAKGGVPYVIPVGGSNAVGTVGYLTMAQELSWQLPEQAERPALRGFIWEWHRGARKTGITFGREFSISCASQSVSVSVRTRRK